MSTRAEYSRELVASHPSYFELDTLFLDDSLVSSAVQQHVASCRQCRHYVQELRTISNSPLPRIAALLAGLVARRIGLGIFFFPVAQQVGLGDAAARLCRAWPSR